MGADSTTKYFSKNDFDKNREIKTNQTGAFGRFLQETLRSTMRIKK